MTKKQLEEQIVELKNELTKQEAFTDGEVSEFKDDVVYIDAREMMKEISTKVELLARYVKEGGVDEELERLGIESKTEKEFEYDYFVIDMRDIHGFNRVNDGNTFVRMNDGGTVWYVDLNYKKFKTLYEKLLTTKIYKPDEII